MRTLNSFEEAPQSFDRDAHYLPMINLECRGLSLKATSKQLNRAYTFISLTTKYTHAEKHYPLAVAGYSRAISHDPENAIYYANRAAAHIRVENYGLALADASKSIELDPRYVKVRILYLFLVA